MRTLVLLLFAALFVYFYTRHKPVEISPEQARALLKAGKYDVIVDVRTMEEWNEGHLQSAISIPIGTFVQELPQKIPKKDTRILFVCRKGIRASAVAGMAQKMGYTNVQAMMGNYRDLL